MKTAKGFVRTKADGSCHPCLRLSTKIRDCPTGGTIFASPDQLDATCSVQGSKASALFRQGPKPILQTETIRYEKLTPQIFAGKVVLLLTALQGYASPVRR